MIECKGQTYKTAEIILLCYKVLCLFCTVTFTSELIAKRHSLSCHYKCVYSTNAYNQLQLHRVDVASKHFLLHNIQKI